MNVRLPHPSDLRNEILPLGPEIQKLKTWLGLEMILPKLKHHRTVVRNTSGEEMSCGIRPNIGHSCVSYNPIQLLQNCVLSLLPVEEILDGTDDNGIALRDRTKALYIILDRFIKDELEHLWHHPFCFEQIEGMSRFLDSLHYPSATTESSTKQHHLT
ncbi:hypothetical protein DKX38_003670 [Salix brachista]|uniref:Uncharacterized protein n=1 Tax=Salix brachista TaxID=2182728 RepID=A0A5N5NS00_9ROSI|nr:hypothetical protein DKX38_003670 [Salix brachista]